MSEETKPVFDVNRPIRIEVPTEAGIKSVRLNCFPSDQDWIDRQARKKLTTIRKSDGSSKDTSSDPDQFDEAMVSRVLAEGEQFVDIEEANYILNRISRAELDEAERDGGCIVVKLQVPGGITSHRLKIPSVKQIRKYQESFVARKDRGNRQEYSFHLPTARDLYQNLVESTEGYADGKVPVIHQGVAVNLAIQELERGLADGTDENF